ncbi:MAG: ABC-type uncharacterized transport system substrate-binding protein [Psychromonas sp.]|jgi:ABC-type uncharacterized transport system substrate-binding protein|uniref:ABC transporter substrate-binding protein n=1 Tax=Psychromonas sp. TaxID=1884585 RepID=UPI0039E26056
MSIIKNLLCILVGVFALSIMPAVAKITDHPFSLEPVLNDGKRWRVGYYEGGEYIEYQKLFVETIKGLMRLGWVENRDIPELKGEQTAGFWKWLEHGEQSDYIEFVQNAHYSSAWDEDVRAKTAQEVISRMNNKNDIDLMIAMGTWAGKDLANNQHSTPTMVISASDPLAAGIIKSVDDSGFDHINATIDPSLHERQLRIFHELVDFKRLGVAYENTVSGRSYAAVEVIKEQSLKLNFKMVACYTKSDVIDLNIAEQSVIECFEKLSKQVDAIYVTSQGGINANSISKLVGITNRNRIPTFSQTGVEEVKYGFMLSLSRAGYKYIGAFHAMTFAKVFNGAKPNQLTQLFEEPPKVALNLKTAEIVGFNPPLLLLGAADEIYLKIQDGE